MVRTRTSKRIQIALILFGTCALSLGKDRSGIADDWVTTQHDAQHTGLSNTVLDPSTLVSTWSTTERYRSPLIVGDTLFANRNETAGGGTASVSSFNVENGIVNWTANVTASTIAYSTGLLAYTSSVINNSIESGLLNVMNASTGVALYSVPVSPIKGVMTLALSQGGQPVAYVSDGRGTLTAVQLGTTSGTVLWTAAGLSAGLAPPSVIGNLVLTSNIDHYYAINRDNGAVTPFKDGPLNGGESYIPVVDSSRNQFYILANSTLTAYSVSQTNAISQIWQVSGTGIGSGGGVALGPDGGIYCTSKTTLVKIDPADGSTLAMVNGSFSNNTTPIVNDQYLFDFGTNDLSKFFVNAYRLSDLSLVQQLAAPNGFSGTTYNGHSALDDTHFVFDFTPGLTVYTGVSSVPEPGSLGLIAGAVLLLKRRRRYAAS